jgi:hypothetical protein
MTIYGNPQLLSEMLLVPSDLPKGQTESAKEGETINPQWLSTPTLVKVNIKMPVDANDVNTEYEDFWYTGYYTIFAVKQIFADGEFTQELDMMSLPVGDEIEKKTDVDEKPLYQQVYEFVRADQEAADAAADAASIKEKTDAEADVSASANNSKIDGDKQTTQQSRDHRKDLQKR